MSPGDTVVYLADPLMYGKLLLLAIEADGRLLCEAVHAEKDGRYARELFEPHELELASVWSAAPFREPAR